MPARHLETGMGPWQRPRGVEVGMAMAWQRRQRIHEQVVDSLWLAPVISGLLGLVCHRLVLDFDQRAHWRLLAYSLDGARAILGSVSAAMLTFIIFLMSMLLIALQIAVGQLTPRIIAAAFRGRVIKATLSVFMFTYLFAVSAQGRVAEPVPQLVMAVAVLLTVASTGWFLFFIDHMGKSLRPVSQCARMAEAGLALIRERYPAPMVDGAADGPAPEPADWGAPLRIILHRGPSGILAGFDAEALARTALRHQCTLRLVPQVGAFVPAGDPLFRVHRGGAALAPEELAQGVAFALERNPGRDLGQVFRIIVDIAIKALSPAINDPTTAVACLDHLHALLARIGGRRLGGGRVLDPQGEVRLTFPDPAWEDYVRLALSEIRDCGAGSIQIVRRLRALLVDLLERLPATRAGELRQQLESLDLAVARNYPDPVERALAMAADHQGMGGAR